MYYVYDDYYCDLWSVKQFIIYAFEKIVLVVYFYFYFLLTYDLCIAYLIQPRIFYSFDIENNSPKSLYFDNTILFTIGYRPSTDPIFKLIVIFKNLEDVLHLPRNLKYHQSIWTGF